jgi:hypothetical protein
VGESFSFYDDVSFLKNHILFQSKDFGLFYFDSNNLLLQNRKPDIKKTIVLTPEHDDGCQYVMHNDDVYKQSNKEDCIVYQESCLLKYKEKVNQVSTSLK